MTDVAGFPPVSRTQSHPVLCPRQGHTTLRRPTGIYQQWQSHLMEELE